MNFTPAPGMLYTGGLMTTRLDWIDVAKGLGIALVVVGHTLRGLMGAGVVAPDGAGVTADRWIYAFHMPLFFVLAGLFLARLADRPLGTYVADRVLRLGYPYVVWVVLQTLLQLVLSRHTNHPAGAGSLVRALWYPPMQFWFIYVLLLQSLLFGLLWKAGLGRIGVLIVSLIAFEIGRWVPMGTWGPLYQARDNLPYLAVGVILGTPGVLERLGVVPAAIAGAVAVVGFGLVTASLWIDGIREVALLAALAGTAATLALSTLVARIRASRFVAAWGRASMAIYCAHTIASAGIRIALQKILHVDNAAIHLVAGVAVGLYGPLALVWLSERVRFPYLFELPRRRPPEAAPQPAA